VITATLYYVLILAYTAHLKDGSTFLNTTLSIHRSDEACSTAGKKRAPQITISGASVDSPGRSTAP